MALIERLEALLASGKDGALLRFGLGTEYLRIGDAPRAAMHLREALALDPGYSAAWKLLGRALEKDDPAAAMRAYGEGIAVAEARGDKQAAKEMQVLRKRLVRDSGPAS